MSKQLEAAVDAAWEKRDGINSATKGEVRDAVEAAIAGLDDGSFRTAEKIGGEWVVNQWLKKAVLLSFRLYDSVPMDGGASFPGMGAAPWFDKVPLKTTGWDAKRFAKANFRSVPGSVIRSWTRVAGASIASRPRTKLCSRTIARYALSSARARARDGASSHIRSWVPPTPASRTDASSSTPSGHQRCRSSSLLRVSSPPPTRRK